MTRRDEIDPDESFELGKTEMTRQDEIDLDKSSEPDKPEMTRGEYGRQFSQHVMGDVIRDDYLA